LVIHESLFKFCWWCLRVNEANFLRRILGDITKASLKIAVDRSFCKGRLSTNLDLSYRYESLNNRNAVGEFFSSFKD
jgi:hypothetical protein